MAGPAAVNPIGGLWPLGKITVAAAGTPVPINTNVGPQKSGASQGAGNPFKMGARIRGLIFSNFLTTTAGKKIYVLQAGATGAAQTNRVIAVFVCGTGAGVTDPQPQSLPPGSLLDGAMPTPDSFSLDADENGASCQVTAIYG